MRYGSVNGVKSPYTDPTGSGTQFTDGCNAIWNLGMRTLKVYLTADYLTDYGLQTSWSSVPTSLTELAQTTQFATQLARAWDTVIFTAFTFANGTTNWWRVEPTKLKLAAEYNEFYALTAHLLTTYNDSGKRFIIQNWEGDWAFMDSFVETTFTARKFVDYYAAFAATRQRAIRDARAAAAHSNVTVLHAFEVNRVLDAKDTPHRRRIITDIAKRFQPDLVSYSVYDSPYTLGWATDQAAWEAACQAQMTRAFRLINKAFPGVPVQLGETGVPELEALNEHPTYDVPAMIDRIRAVALERGAETFIYWQTFANDLHVTYGYRGFWLRRPDGTLTQAGARMQAYAAGG